MQKPTPEPQSSVGPPAALDDPKLGADLLARSSPQQLPDRAKAIAALRRATELFKYCDPRITTDVGLVTLVDVAARDVGLRPEELRAILRKDAEVKELERRFVDAVRATFPR